MTADALNINTHVRDCVAELERAVADPELIVDPHLLERVTGLAQRFAQLRKQGPQRLKQARSARRKPSPAAAEGKPRSDDKPSSGDKPRSGGKSSPDSSSAAKKRNAS